MTFGRQHAAAHPFLIFILVAMQDLASALPKPKVEALVAGPALLMRGLSDISSGVVDKGKDAVKGKVKEEVGNVQSKAQTKAQSAFLTALLVPICVGLAAVGVIGVLSWYFCCRKKTEPAQYEEKEAEENL